MGKKSEKWKENSTCGPNTLPYVTVIELELFSTFIDKVPLLLTLFPFMYLPVLVYFYSQ